MDEKLQLLREGDHAVFEELVLKYRDEGVRFALNILKDYYTAEDIAQDSFASFYVYRERLKKYSTLKSYLFSIIHNKSVDYIRKNKKYIYDGYNNASTISAEEIVMKKEKEEQFMNNFHKLNRNEKNVLYLYGIQQMSYKEISEILDMSMAKVKITIFRARKKLKALWFEEQCL